MSGRFKEGSRSPFQQVKQFAANMIGLLQGKTNSYVKSFQLEKNAHTLLLTEATAKRIRSLLAGQLHKQGGAKKKPLPLEFRALVDRIRLQTIRANRNNVTRTAAYLEFFQQHPEVHWAFLAHMVSRNGGWNMTDLRGELLPRLLRQPQIESMFLFLERANALIFQDAYPQLLIYQESRRLRRPLFELLAQFDVSGFMLPLWELFWNTADSVALTQGLIINEQHYIEGRIVQNPYYKEQVLDTLFFQMQALLQLNQVVFPYREENVSASNHQPPSVVGLVLEDFSDLHERIEVGKKLYALLFGVPRVLQGALSFAQTVPHSGSRADFWPRLFAPIRKAPPAAIYRERLDGCKLRESEEPFYSPVLSNAWNEPVITVPESYDWFRQLSSASYFGTVKAPFPSEITGEYCFGLHKIELAIIAGQELNNLSE